MKTQQIITNKGNTIHLLCFSLPTNHQKAIFSINKQDKCENGKTFERLLRSSLEFFHSLDDALKNYRKEVRKNGEHQEQ